MVIWAFKDVQWDHEVIWGIFEEVLKVFEGGVVFTTAVPLLATRCWLKLNTFFSKNAKMANVCFVSRAACVMTVCAPPAVRPAYGVRCPER